jgi:hypothetical protein
MLPSQFRERRRELIDRLLHRRAVQLHDRILVAEGEERFETAGRKTATTQRQAEVHPPCIEASKGKCRRHRPGAAVRSALDLGVDGFVASVGYHVHELCLGFRYPSLSLKPLSKGRYDYIALVPLDFRPPERHRGKLQPNFPGTLRRTRGDLLGLAGRESRAVRRSCASPTSAAGARR